MINFTDALKLSIVITAVDRFSTVIDRVTRKVNDLGTDADKSLAKTAENFNKVGNVLLGVGAVAIGVTASMVTAAAKWEQLLVGVRKTTGLEGSPLALLSEDLLELSTRMPKTAEEIAEMAVVAGQLGVHINKSTGAMFDNAIERLSQFTEVTSKMSISDNTVSAEGWATFFARMSNVFDIPISDIERLGSSVNELANTTTATGEHISNVMTRIGKATDNISAEQVAALAATLSDVGVPAERAGTAMRRALIDMTVRRKQIAQMLKMPLATYDRMFNEDTMGTFIFMLEKMAEMPQTERASNIAKIFGKFGYEAINKLTGNIDILRKNLNTSLTAWEQNISIAQESARASDTVAARTQMLENTLFFLRVEMGTALLPVMSAVLDVLRGFTKWLARMPDWLKTTIGHFTLWGGVVAIGTGLFLKFVSALIYLKLLKPQIIKTLLETKNQLIDMFRYLSNTKAIRAMGQGIKWFGSVSVNVFKTMGKFMWTVFSNPTFLAIAGITAAIIGLIYLIKNWNKVMAWAKGNWKAFIGTIKWMWEAFVDDVSYLLSGIVGTAIKALNAVGMQMEMPDWIEERWANEQYQRIAKLKNNMMSTVIEVSDVGKDKWQNQANLLTELFGDAFISGKTTMVEILKELNRATWTGTLKSTQGLYDLVLRLSELTGVELDPIKLQSYGLTQLTDEVVNFQNALTDMDRVDFVKTPFSQMYEQVTGRDYGALLAAALSKSNLTQTAIEEEIAKMTAASFRNTGYDQAEFIKNYIRTLEQKFLGISTPTGEFSVQIDLTPKVTINPEQVFPKVVEDMQNTIKDISFTDIAMGAGLAPSAFVELAKTVGMSNIIKWDKFISGLEGAELAAKQTSIVSMIASAIDENGNIANGAMERLASGLIAYLPQSPAKVGPLRGLSKVGKAIVGIISTGIKTSLSKAADVMAELGSKMKTTFEEEMKKPLNVTLGSFLKNLGLSSAIKDINDLIGMINTFSETPIAKGIDEQLGGKVSGFLSTLSTVMGGETAALAATLGEAGMILSAVITGVNTAYKLFGKEKWFRDMVGPAEKELKRLYSDVKEFFSPLTELFKSIAPFIGKMLSLLVQFSLVNQFKVLFTTAKWLFTFIQKVFKAIEKTFEPLRKTFREVKRLLDDTFERLNTAWKALWESIKPLFDAGLDLVIETLIIPLKIVAALLTPIVSGIAWVAEKIAKFVNEIVDIIYKIANLFGIKWVRTQPETGKKYASGGLVSGRGTSVSDSIPAWLSNGEFVMNARATKENLPTLQAMNRGQLTGNRTIIIEKFIIQGDPDPRKTAEVIKRELNKLLLQSG